MKSRTEMWMTVVCLFAALAVTIQLSAQDNSQPKVKHNKYKVVEIGTFGGPHPHQLGSVVISTVREPSAAEPARRFLILRARSTSLTVLSFMRSNIGKASPLTLERFLEGAIAFPLRCNILLERSQNSGKVADRSSNRDSSICGHSLESP